MRRVIARGGRGRAHLGGGLATAADLAATVAGLIDIASQHDQQSLTDPESQLAILDAFAENQRAARRDGRGARGAGGGGGGAGVVLRRRAGARPSARICCGSSSASWRRRGPAPGEDEALAAERERLKGRRAVLRGHGARRGGALRRRRRGGRAARRRGARARAAGARSIRRWRRSASGSRDAQAAIEDVARDLGRYARGIRSDPARLAEVEERLFLLQRLCRKHGGTVADLAARRAALRARARRSSARSRRGWRRARPRPRSRRRARAAAAAALERLAAAGGRPSSRRR